MSVPRLALLLWAALWVSTTSASAQSFFANYLKPQYLVPVLDFPSSSGGDLNLTYYQIQIPTFSNGELLILGEFPRARYFSITAYDDHGAIVGTLNDRDIRAYGTTANPWVPGGPAGAEDMLYAVSVRLGAPASPPILNCATPLDVHENTLDFTQRHTAGTFYSAQQSGFSATVPGYGNVNHMDATTNSGGLLLIRSYLREPPAANSQFDLRKPLVWLRSVVSGCAAQIAPAGQYLQPSQWYTLGHILKLDQAYAHIQHEVDLGTSTPYGPDPESDSTWYGRQEYLPGQAVGRYLANLPDIDTTGYSSRAEALNAQDRVLRLRFRLPQLPCHTDPTCGLTGSEQLRYWSLTFETEAGVSLATISELDLTPDGSGDVDMVVSFGTELPAHISPENGYSPIVLPPIDFARIVMRNYLPAAPFTCVTDNVPFRTAEFEPAGGYMGAYAPLVFTPFAATLPGNAPPLQQSGSCQAQ